MKWLIILLWTVTLLICNNAAMASNISNDMNIEYFCQTHKLANDYQFGEQYWTNGERCAAIWKAQYRFENVSRPYLIRNNIFWLRRNGIMRFDSVEDSIKFWVDRYFRYEYRKTIQQIIMWWCYYNLSNKWVCFNWYTLTKNHQYNYYNYVKVSVDNALKSNYE